MENYLAFFFLLEWVCVYQTDICLFFVQIGEREWDPEECLRAKVNGGMYHSCPYSRDQSCYLTPPRSSGGWKRQPARAPERKCNDLVSLQQTRPGDYLLSLSTLNMDCLATGPLHLMLFASFLSFLREEKPCLKLPVLDNTQPGVLCAQTFLTPTERISVERSVFTDLRHCWLLKWRATISDFMIYKCLDEIQKVEQSKCFHSIQFSQAHVDRPSLFHS